MVKFSVSFIALATTACAAPPALTRFDFRTTPATLYTSAAGYGLLSADAIPATPGPLTSTKPFFFVVDLPEGNYDVTVLLGDPAAPSDTTVKSETRRLQLESIRVPATSAAQPPAAHTFTVNVRTPAIANTSHRVALKPRELATFTWDDKLILEFNGPRPSVATLDIRRNDSALTLYLAGDSTVTDQPGEPWAAWGQMLPRFFPAGVAIANHAESGLSLASFRASRRLGKILSTLRPGDYVFIQFGHNDQKETGEGVGALTTYAQSLRDYVAAIRAAGGEPVLLTPMYRRRFDATGSLYDTLGDFPVAVRQVAQETATPLIDLHAMSARLFSALGPEPSKLAFVHFPAGAYGSDKAVKDDTHFSPFGAYQLARCIVEGIRQNVPALAARLAPGLPSFDPDQPTALAAFNVPPSPLREEIRIPDGDGR